MTTPLPRSSEFPIDPAIMARWSPRAFLPVPISEPELLGILEAGRWAPSAFNAQPWRFIYARRDTAPWAGFLDMLSPFNQDWAQNASALVVVASRTLRRNATSGEETPMRSHSFDAGAAWGLVALQAIKLGWHTHGMGGFDQERARDILALPEHYRLEIVFALGRRGGPETLPEGLRAREIPNHRKALSEIATEGVFGED